MRHRTIWFLSCLLVLGMASLVRADDPTSRFLPLTRLASSLPSSSTGTAVQFEVWDQATAGTMIFSEAHTVDTDAGSNISNDTGLTDLLLGRGTVGGLAPANFPAGSTRYLDVTQSGVTVLAARVPLYASVFSVSAPNEVPGNLAMVNSTATEGNILKGGVLFLHNFGSGNTFLGQDAGNLSTTGEGGNTGVGVSALKSISTGVSNTAIGGGALFSNTTGSFNTASGVTALQYNTTGSYNTASGVAALVFNTTGSNNTASGAQALRSNTTGGSNTASGFNALQNNDTGSDNTAMGANALQNNTDGHDNTASGASALQNNTTGSYNTATGRQALFSNTTGSSNVATGHQALYSNTTGTGNVAVGSSSLQSNTGGANNVAIGEGGLQSNTTGGRNTATGEAALSNNTTGSRNTAAGFLALFGNTTGDENTALGYSARVSAGNLTNATAIGAFAIVDASDKIRLGNNSVTVVEGPPYSTVSDKNKKENLKPVDGEEVLRKINRLSVTSWNYIGHDPKQFRHYGPVGQDFFAAFGNDGIGTIGTPTTITSTDMAGILMVAVQALDRRTADLATLKAENADLKARLEKLEHSVASSLAKAE